MRKLKLQIQTTVDGYMCGPNGEMDWMLFEWSDDVGTYIWDMTGSVDTIVMGRNLAEGFIPHWASGPESEPPQAVEWMNSRAKVVVSNTLETSPWESAVIASGDGAESVRRLKSESGGDLIAYGGSLVTSLIAAEQIDELHLFVHPTAIGSGKPVFGADSYARLNLVKATPFDCGITALHYEPKQA